MTADISERWSDFVGQVNNVLRYFKKQRLDVKYEYKLLRAITSFLGLIYGICHVMSWVLIPVICDQLEGRALGECGAFRQTCTLFHYFVNF